MTNQPKLAERAILMRLSISMPGESRKDSNLTESVKSEHSLGSEAGKWLKALYPKQALEPIKTLVNKVRDYHNSVTLPFDSGIGILPAAMIEDYRKNFLRFRSEFEALTESHFLANYDRWVAWARNEHNGTFDASLYPGVDETRKKFSFKIEPVPVPDSAHYQGTLASLLGTDVESVNLRVQDAMQQAQKELLKRLIEPVKAMAQKLVDFSEGKIKRFHDTLVGNILEIVELAPKLNIAGDSVIDGFAAEIKAAMAGIVPDDLRTDEEKRKATAAKAAEIASRMAEYSL